MRHVAAFVLLRHAGIISPPSAMLHPEGAVGMSGLDREGSGRKTGTKPVHFLRTFLMMSPLHTACVDYQLVVEMIYDLRCSLSLCAPLWILQALTVKI